MTDAGELERVTSRRFSGDEPIGESGKTVVDFWRWSSDLLENVQRGIFAEYVVASALGVTEHVKFGWAGYDLRYGAKKIEVKSSSYLQSWKQKALTKPSFGIGPREQWDEETGVTSDPVYVADAFVFCLFAHRDPATADILDMHQWEFFVVNTEILKARFDKSRSLGESRLRSLTSPVPIEHLRERCDAVLADANAFLLSQDSATGQQATTSSARYAYAVGQRGTRATPVIVTAADYREAFDLARVDPTIASYGADISAIRLSAAALAEALSSGVRDLRLTP